MYVLWSNTNIQCGKNVCCGSYTFFLLFLGEVQELLITSEMQALRGERRLQASAAFGHACFAARTAAPMAGLSAHSVLRCVFTMEQC